MWGKWRMFQRECPFRPRPGSFQAVQSKVKENIMNNREIVQTLLDSVQKGDFVKIKSLFADNFQFSGPIPEPMNRDAWLGMSASLRTASGRCAPCSTTRTPALSRSVVMTARGVRSHAVPTSAHASDTTPR